MSEHTPGKVAYQEESDDYTHILRFDGMRFFCQLGQDKSGETEANARRLVACWNLCDGVPTEQVEAATDLWRLLAERAEMLRVVLMAKRVCEAVGIKCPSGSEDAFADLWQAAGNVIAKASGMK